MKNKCAGCAEEKNECYRWQSKGYDAGLDWNDQHCAVFVLNHKGEFIVL